MKNEIFYMHYSHYKLNIFSIVSRRYYSEQDAAKVVLQLLEAVSVSKKYNYLFI